MTTHPEHIRKRALFLGTILSVLICLLTPYNNIYRHATPLGGGHFPLAPFFIILWMVLLVGAAGRWTARPLLSGREMMIIWICMTLSSGIAYTGLARTFFINLTAPFHFATLGNGWENLLQPLLPDSLYPRDAAAIQGFYDGLPSGRQTGWMSVLARIPWADWLSPLAAWGVFIFTAYGVLICLVNLMGRQWVHYERMNLPLLRVPNLLMEAMDEKKLGRFLLDRFFLIGIGFPVLLHLINGLNAWFPEVPHIPTLILAGPYFPKSGFLSGFAKLKIHIYPAFIGFAFLTSRQISFSFWLFFILCGLLLGLLSLLGYNIPDAALGVTFGPTLTRPEETQMIGAYLVFFVFIVWLARYHLRDAARQGLGLDPAPDGETEWFSIRKAFWGAILGFLAMALWCAAFGMPLMISPLVVGVFLVFMIVASRIVCQGGIAYFTLTVAPIDGLLAFFGSKILTPAGIVIAAAAQKVLFVDLRESLMPSLFHGSAISHPVSNKRPVFTAVLATIGAAVVTSFAAMLALCYRYGARELAFDWETQTTLNVYTSVTRLLTTPQTGSHWVLIFTAAGALVMLVLVICYQRFFWWPIHPIGYLTAYSSAMRILWFSFVVGCACNALCMHYGGVALFRRIRMLFIGLIVGDFLMGGIWAGIGLFGDINYQVLPD